MAIDQCEIIEIAFPLPDGTCVPHPAIVISNSDINAAEDSVVCVMITSSQIFDEYSFQLANEMLSKPMLKPCQVRCHLITLIPNKHITRRIGSIKKIYFKKLIDQINNSLFRII